MQQKIFTTPSEQCTSLLIRDTQPARSIPAASPSLGSAFTATKRSARKALRSALRQPQTTLYGHRGFGEDGEPGEATPGACRWLRMGPLVCAVPPDTTRSLLQGCSCSRVPSRQRGCNKHYSSTASAHQLQLLAVVHDAYVYHQWEGFFIYVFFLLQ